MSAIEGHNGYYLKKTGARVNELLSRHFIVPTLSQKPTLETLTWKDGDYTVAFRVGEFVRVKVNDDYWFYRLKDITVDGAIWVDAAAADMENYYTRKEIDNKLSNIIISGGGGVITLSSEEYATKVERGEIIDNILYFVIADDEPYELYIGLHLIAKKGVVENYGFPYTFPITF